MAASQNDFSNPEVPTSQRDFWVLYWHDRKEWKEKLEEITKSQTEDREDVVKFIDKIDDWIKNHDACLAVNMGTLTRHDEKINTLDKRVNTWNLTNSLAAIGAFITALFMKGS